MTLHPTPKDILVLGAGQIGAVVAALLAGPSAGGDYRVTLADRLAGPLASLAKPPHLSTQRLDIGDPRALRAAMQGRFAVLNAAPFSLALPIARAARAAGIHYLDLTEDVSSTRAIRALADGAEQAFIPQCGLAPGYVSIVAADLARRFETLDAVRLRVGALPAYPSNALNYNLTWSTEGVINEYCEPCDAIVDGHLCSVPALEGLEAFSIDGVRYEAFNTSGGLGTLAETLAGRVNTLNYRTIRYPGHAAVMKLLLDDLRLRERRDVLKDVLEQALPTTRQDVVVVFVTVTGRRNDRLEQETHAQHIPAQMLAGAPRTAIQLTTASSLCAMLDLLAEGKLPQRGFVRQEELALADFLGNRFGRVFASTPQVNPRDASARQADAPGRDQRVASTERLKSAIAVS